ncbi:hypothetical protein HDE_10061 [Halotydeus destructor]|nr:hypothetical protein HDE_10061 [Halotydeus destructor]
MKIVLLVSVILTINEVESQCGFPGIPNGIDEANFKFLKTTEQSIAYYRCKDANDIILNDPEGLTGLKSYAARTCQKGTWLGRLPQCGKKTDHDIHLGELTVVHQDGEQNVLLSTAEHPAYELNVNENSCLLVEHNVTEWRMKLLNYSLNTYVEFELMLAEDYEEETKIHNIGLTLDVGKNHKCELVTFKSVPRYAVTHSGNQGIIRSFLLNRFNSSSSTSYFVTVVGFLCERIALPTKNMTYDNKIDSFFSNTATLHSELEDIIEAFCDVKVFHPEPFRCGRAEVPLNGKHKVNSRRSTVDGKYGHLTEFLQANVTYECEKHFELYFVDNEYEINGGLLCGPDGRWMGTTPTCKPINSCSMNQPKEADRISVDFASYTYWNQTKVAYKGTTATYSCKGNDSSPDKLAMMGHQILSCRETGNWSSPEPRCLYQSELTTDSIDKTSFSIQTSFFPIIYSLFAILLLLSIVAGLTLYIYSHKLNAKKMAERQARLDRARINIDMPTKKDDDNYYTICYNEKRKSENYIIPTDEYDYNEADDYVNMDRSPNYGSAPKHCFKDDQHYLDVIENYANEFIHSRNASYEEVTASPTYPRPRTPTSRRPPKPQDPVYDDVCYLNSYSGK